MLVETEGQQGSGFPRGNEKACRFLSAKGRLQGAVGMGWSGAMPGSCLPLERLPLAPLWEGDHRARVAASTRKFQVPVLVKLERSQSGL